MTEAEERFAEKLAQDLADVLGTGFAIGDVEIESNGRVHVSATILAEGHIEAIDVEAASVLEAYPELIRRAAELRLAGAWTRMITLT